MPQALGRKSAIPEEFYRFDLHPGYRQLRILNEGAARMGVHSPFFKLHEGTAGAATRIGAKPYVNYASYNYLGMSGDPVITQAAKDAIDRRSEEHTSELQSLMRISYAVFCLKKKKYHKS